MTTNVADYVLQRLRKWGVEHAFSYAGDGINGLPAAWERAENKPTFKRLRQVQRQGRDAYGDTGQTRQQPDWDADAAAPFRSAELNLSSPPSRK